MLKRLALILCVLPLAANGLDALRASLRRPAAEGPLKASVDFQNWSSRGDAKKPVVSQGKAVAWAEDGPKGLKLFWSRDQLRQAQTETRLQTEDPERTTPTRDAMAGLTALALQDYFDAAPRLLEDLEQATLLEERPDALDGRPCRLLVLKLDPKLSERNRKYVKELDAGAKVWVDAEGSPLAMDLRVKVKGKALLVITFASDQHDEYRFAQVGGHLVTLRHLSENTSSGAGESGSSRKVATLAFN